MVGRVGPGDVEPVGVGEPGRVTVGRPDQAHHPLPARHRIPEHVRVLLGPPRGHLHGGVEAQDLLDGVLGQAGVGDQPVPLPPVAQQGHHPVADEVHRRLEPRDQQQAAHRGQLARRQTAVVVLGDQRREHVLARVGPAVLRHPGEHRVEFPGGGADLPELARRPGAVQSGPDHRADPHERLVVALADPQEPGDDGDRQRLGVVAHQVEVAALQRRVQQRLGGLLDLGPVPGHTARRESRARHLAQACVVGRIHLEEGKVHHVVLRLRREALRGLDSEGTVGQDVRDGGVRVRDAKAQPGPGERPPARSRA
ncbi:hypothetical protein BJF83_21315 [Nocardiopsis sp. CNR-923]|nr:hypothetical protein BJF83_21315 [Nocardiopsis sp. CNR-923]